MSTRELDLGTDGAGNRARIEIRFEGERVAVTGTIARYGHVWSWGQCTDAIADMYPGRADVAEFVTMWHRWHLNDMRAGCAHQESHYRFNPIDRPTSANGYQGASGDTLSPSPGSACAQCGYAYGSAWNLEPIPADVRAYFETVTL